MDILKLKKEDLIGKEITYNLKSLFGSDKNLLDKEIVICDFEMNGRRGKECEIIEFTGILVVNGIIKDYLHFKCKHKEYGFAKDLLENKEFFSNFDMNEYNNRPYIDEFKEQFINFICNRTILIWGAGYDNWAIIRLFILWGIKKQVNTIRYIDFQKWFDSVHIEQKEQYRLNKTSFSLDKIFINSIETESLYDDVYEICGINVNDLLDISHSSIADVWKLIFVMFLVRNEKETLGNNHNNWSYPRNLYDTQSIDKTKKKKRK